MNLDVRSNPALLKLDLYCKGMRLDDSCLVEEDGGRKVMRTRAGLGPAGRAPPRTALRTRS